MKKLLVINPGSTSTKVAVYEDNNPKWTESITHSTEDLRSYKNVYDQLEMRRNLIEKCVEDHGDKLDDFTAIVSRGGNLPPVSAGAYEVNEYMVDCLHYRPGDQHASNVGAGIALEIANQIGVKAYIYDAITVDEMLPINKITGYKGILRPARGHNLNMRAAALKVCEIKNLDYEKCNLIVVHLGGGITISLFSNGKIIDIISDDEGPFSPERAGGLPHYEVIKKCYFDGNDYDETMRSLQRRGGMISHFGTSDMREIEDLYDLDKEDVKMVYHAMALAVAKNISKLAPVVAGAIDYIVLTGGLAYSDRFVGEVSDKVKFLSPIEVIPGENEMESLANGVLRVLSGEEKAKQLVEA